MASAKWFRCPRSTFYRLSSSEFEHTYLDPVEFSFVGISGGLFDRDPAVTILSRQILEIAPDGGFIYLNEKSKARLHAWMQRVIEASGSGAPSWEMALLADLDVDPVERDHLLNIIYTYIVRYPSELLGNTQSVVTKVPRDHDQIRNELEVIGVDDCYVVD